MGPAVDVPAVDAIARAILIVIAIVFLTIVDFAVIGDKLLRIIITYKLLRLRLRLQPCSRSRSLYRRCCRRRRRRAAAASTAPCTAPCWPPRPHHKAAAAVQTQPAAGSKLTAATAPRPMPPPTRPHPHRQRHRVGAVQAADGTFL